MYNLTTNTKKQLEKLNPEIRKWNSTPRFSSEFYGKTTKIYVRIAGQYFCILTSPKHLSFAEIQHRINACSFWLTRVLN